MYWSFVIQATHCKLSVLLTFHIDSTPIWRFGYLASRKASIDYTPFIYRINGLRVLTDCQRKAHYGCKPSLAFVFLRQELVKALRQSFLLPICNRQIVCGSYFGVYEITC